MRTALALLLIPLAATGCTAAYQDGFDDGCYYGGLDGAMYGGIDAALCYASNPDPGPALGGPTRYDLGYSDGYQSCFPDAYLDAWSFSLALLEDELGACEELL